MMLVRTGHIRDIPQRDLVNYPPHEVFEIPDPEVVHSYVVRNDHLAQDPPQTQIQNRVSEIDQEAITERRDKKTKLIKKIMTTI